MGASAQELGPLATSAGVATAAYGNGRADRIATAAGSCTAGAFARGSHAGPDVRRCQKLSRGTLSGAHHSITGQLS